MKIKRTLAMVLCLCMALSYIPALNLVAHAATQTVRIEAENAYWYGYGSTPKTVSGASGKVVGDATGTYATWEEFRTGKLNKKIHNLVVFCVDVPAAGTYQVAVGNRVCMNATTTPYAAIAVNPLSGASTVAYKLTYNGQAGTSGVILKSKAVSVQLQKGRNVIYMAPFTSDQNEKWADADYIEITGAQAVTHVAPTKVSVAPNAGYYYRFTNVSSGGLKSGDFDKSNPKKLSASTVTTQTVSNLPFASYTVEAPEDGYYNIDLKYSTAAANTASNYAIALLVDGKAAEVKTIYAGSDIADISTYLTKGTHVLTIPTILPRSTTSTMDWTDLLGLTLHDGLTLSKYQKCPVQSNGNVLEAERDAFLWRYPTVEVNNGNIAVGGSQPGAVKQTYSELASGARLDKNQPMLTYYVDVETAGDYTMKVSYHGYTGSDYYMIVSVDDESFAKAAYAGNDTNYTNRQMAKATLNLTAGRHYIRLITLPKDTGASWINVDYALFTGPGNVAAMNDWKHLQSGNAKYIHGFTNTNYTANASLGSQWQKALSGYQGNSMADAAGITTDNFTPADLNNLGWFSYTVNVPEDGFYDMQTYLHPAQGTSGTGKILLGVENINANLINQAQGVLALNYTGESSGWMDVDGQYQAIRVTAKNYLPMTQSTKYAMVLRVGLDNGKFYAFQIANDQSARYSYSRYGAEGSASGSNGKVWVDQKDAAATDLINGTGAEFKLERTAANTLTVTLNGTVMDTYTMEGVTADNKVVSVGFKQCGNPANDNYVVEVPFALTEISNKVNVRVAPFSNGTVVADKTTCNVGDTVTLTVTADAGYSQRLTINGEPIVVDWKTGKYSFVATENSYQIGGSFTKIGNWSDNANAVMLNEARGVIGLNYTGNDSQYLDLTGNYKSISVITKNYLPVEQSYEGVSTGGGYRIALRMNLDNGKNYAFSIWIDTEKRYAYNHFGAASSATGWGGAWRLIEQKDIEMLNGDGAEFKLERIDGNHFQITLNETVLETYTIPEVTAENQVVSVGVRNYGNPASSNYRVDMPFAVEKVGSEAAVTVDIPNLANGTVTAEMPVYKIGDIVELTVTPDEGYNQKLTLNGKPILLDWKTGKYSFVATEEAYVIAGSFEKELWSDTKYKWVDVRLDKNAEKWWIADLSSYLTKGEYFILVSGLMDYTDGTVKTCDMGALTVSGGITALGTAVDPSTRLNPSVSQWSIILGDRIGVKFCFKNLLSSDSVAFYHGDTLLDSENSGDSTYIAYIDPAQMTDEITIKINGVALTRTYSVRTYANVILAGAYEENTKNLVREMLNYGGASQLYFQYHTERLANADLNVGNRDLTSLLPLSATEYTFENNIKGVYFYGTSLLFRERNAVRFYFSGDTTGCTFRVGGQTVIPVEINNLTCVEVANITPQQFNDAVQVTVTRGTETITVQYSPMNYLDRMYQKSTASEELKNVLSAMYYFHQAAAGYQHIERETLTNVVTQVSKPNELFYRNDNLTGQPDPFVLDNTARDGYYYLYGTWGAFRCYRSKNLMDWEYYGEVLQQWRENNKVWDSTNQKYSYQVLGNDLWAPEVVYDADTKLYYMFFSATPDIKNQAVKGSATEMLMVATSTSPTGPFNLVDFKNANSCGAGNVHSYSTTTYADYFAKYLLLDPAQNKTFSTKINNGEWRGEDNGGYAGGIDAHPFVAPDGKKYLFWVDSNGPDRICGVEMENWLKPKWETATVLTYYHYYTVADWQKAQSGGKVETVSYEYRTTTNEGPFITAHNGKYYMTFSVNNWKNNSYLVAQAVSDNVLGPYTKLKESEGGIVLSGNVQGSKENTGTGHHSIVAVGDQLLMVYHRHTDPYTGTVNDPSGDDHSKRNHAIDEIKWVTINGREVMYVNGPSANLQPRVEKHSTYRNIAEEAAVTSNVSSANPKYLNDGLLSHLKKGNANVTNAVAETKLSGTTTFTFTFDKARTVKSIMVYNSRQEAQIFRQIEQIRLLCVEDGKVVAKYINAVPFNSEYYTTDSNGKVTYVEPCAAAYAIFNELQVLSVEITVSVPDGQTNVGISEVRILGK